jgi:hypothetical protein
MNNNATGQTAPVSQNAAFDTSSIDTTQTAQASPSTSMGGAMPDLSGFDTNSAPSMPDMSGFGGGDTVAAMPPMPSTMVMDPNFSPTPAPSAEPANLVPMPDFAAMSAPSMPSPDMGVSTPVMSTSEFMTDIDAPAPISMPAMDMPVPVSTTSSSAPAMSAPAPIQLKAPTASTGAKTDTDAVLAKLDGVAAQMDQIVNRIGRLERDLSKVKSSNKDVSALSRELKTIKGQLSSVQAPRSNVQTQRAPALPRVSSIARQPAVTSKAAPASDKWALKGIAKNTAWIAKEGQTDITKVMVGDTVKGLGRIMSIGLENGVWMIRGQHGTITQ